MSYYDDDSVSRKIICFFVFLILFALLIFIIAYGLNCLGDMKGELKSIECTVKFPKDYKFTGTKVEVVKQIGNAVPPNFAKAIFNEIEENCEIIDRESFFTFDFMEVCFSSGYNLADKPLCIKKEDVNHHVNKALNKLMCIKLLQEEEKN